MDENALQLAAIGMALLDADRHLRAKLRELADLDRGAERTGAQLEAQPLVIVTRAGLDIADDVEIEEREADRV